MEEALRGDSYCGNETNERRWWGGGGDHIHSKQPEKRKTERRRENGLRAQNCDTYNRLFAFVIKTHVASHVRVSLV